MWNYPSREPNFVHRVCPRYDQRRPVTGQLVDQAIAGGSGKPKSILRPPSNTFASTRRDQPMHPTSAYRDSYGRGLGHASTMMYDRRRDYRNAEHGHANYTEPGRQNGQGQPLVSEQKREAKVATKAQPDVEVVDVPEHHVFFTLPVATRQSTLDKLNLNSLFEYIEHLDKYRLEKRDNIVQFHKCFHSMLKEEQMRRQDKGLEDQDFANCQEKTTAEVSLQVESIEKRLEEYRAKSLTGTRFESCLVAHHKETEDSLEETEDISPPPTGKLGAGIKVDENVEVEVIDLTYREELAKIKANLPTEIQEAEKQPKEQELSEETLAKVEIDDPITTITEDVKKSPFDCGSCVMHSCISVVELQARLREMQFKPKQTKIKSPIALMDFSMQDLDTVLAAAGTNNKAASTNPVESTIRDVTTAAPSTGHGHIKLNIGGHQLPLPKEFSQLAPAQKNSIICQLPELIRGQYLGMVWQSSFYEHLAANTCTDELAFNL